MNKEQQLEHIKDALREYHEGKTRDLPSVKKSTTRAWLHAVDDLIATLDEVFENGKV